MQRLSCPFEGFQGFRIEPGVGLDCFPGEQCVIAWGNAGNMEIADCVRFDLLEQLGAVTLRVGNKHYLNIRHWTGTMVSHDAVDAASPGTNDNLQLCGIR